VITAAAAAVAKLSDATTRGVSLLPSMDDLRTVSAAVAIAVATTAAAEGHARVDLRDPIQQVQDAMWRTEYPHIEVGPQ
jgi:malate dehydrogenase (oxaloacetate-decarboxylating)